MRPCTFEKRDQLERNMRRRNRNSSIHGCMEALKDWLADLVGHLESAPGFRRRHCSVLLKRHQPQLWWLK
jgi:hypothetical protein